MQSVDADVFEVEGAESTEAVNALRALAWVHGVTQLGVRLRVLADRGTVDAANQLHHELQRLGVESKITPTHASLEDVFVVATRPSNGKPKKAAA